MAQRETIIQIENVTKQYRLGTIGGGTLKGDLQSLWARLRHREDPNRKIGQEGGKNQAFLALDQVNLEIKRGERLGIIGHNGAGKSTLLKLLCRVTLPTEGEIRFNGRIASMLEVGTGFHPELTGRENIYLNGAILGMTKAEVARKMEDIIDFSECRQFIDTPVKRYSSGMYVKLAFSVAAHLDSEIMIMDEVLAVGDMQFSKKCLDKMSELARTEGRTILYVSHNMNTIRQLCDRCIVLERGHIVFDGNVEEAISVYMGGVQDNLAVEYVYDDKHRIREGASEAVKIQSLSVLGKTENRFQPNEKAGLRLVCRGMEAVEDLRFRFEIQYSDGTLAGTMLTDQGVTLKKDQDNAFEMDFDVSHLAPGRYRADLVAFVHDRFGEELYLDGVYPAMVFEIDDRVEGENELLWNHRYWGHIRLHDARTKT